MELCRSLVGGKPVAGSRPPIDKHYPATGEVIARIEPADEAVLDQAVAVASEAQREWGARSGAERSAILQAAADGLRARNDECVFFSCSCVVKKSPFKWQLFSRFF